MIGGTSVAAPIVASAFALAGGSHEVAYPAQTLYENERGAPATLHDVTIGSNGQCRKRVSAETGEARCTTEELARSCAAQAICLAGLGYDGPSGVGTPAGIDALLPLSEHVDEASGGSGEAPGLSGVSSSGSGSTSNSTPTGDGSQAPAASSGATSSGSAAGAATSPNATPGVLSRPRVPVISALRLTRAARAATAHRRARLSQLTFAFDASAAVRTRVALAKLVHVHGRARWQTVAGPSTILAKRGEQTHRMRGTRTLAAGRYRLELAVAGGSTRSLTFTVG
jgi:hypothetical protein